MTVSLEGQYGCLWTGPIGDEQRYCVQLGENGLENLGEGGEGLVYYALRSSGDLQSPVALKMLTSVGPADYARVADRCCALESVHHPHIMRQYETFLGPALWSVHAPDASDFDILYSVAEWIPGVALSTAVEMLKPAQSLQLVGQIAKAVSFLHSFSSPLALNGIVHRDIKPSNVHVTPTGEAVLIDFGMAKPQDENEMTRGAGTFLWRAPEVLGGPGMPGKESDAWGIGALAYWVVVGEPTRLEGADSAREQILQMARELELPDPPALASHISSLLESRPRDRLTDLDHWANILEPILSGARRRARNLRLGLVATGAALVVVALAIVLMSPHPGHITSGTWSAPVIIDSHRQLDSVSCASPDFCMAADTGGTMLSYDGTRWHTLVNTGNLLGTVSCVSSKFCEAVGYDNAGGDVFAFDGSSLSDGDSIDPGFKLHSISCASSSFCVAGAATNVFTFNGTSWSAAQPIDAGDSSGEGLTSISCPTASFCAAVDGNGNAFVLNGSTWTAALSLDSGVELTSVSCPTASFCAAVNANGNVSTFDGKSWSSEDVIDSDVELNGVSCPTARFCAAVDAYGNFLTFNGTTWTSPESIGSGDDLTSISCPSTTYCAAVDANGEEMVER